MYSASVSTMAVEAVYEKATAWYQDSLKRDSGGVLSYLMRRGLTEQTIEEMRIGYAPNAWADLTIYLLAEGVSPEEMCATGLVISKPEGLVDRYNNRAVFPVVDFRGRVIAMSARTLVEATPKYMATPRYEGFEKKDVLFGLDQRAIYEIARTENVILVEGNFDVAVMRSYGFFNVVAPLGTALTREQTILLAILGKRVYVLFDDDAAGKTAAEKTDKRLRDMDVEPILVSLEGGHDPASFLTTFGHEEMRKKLNVYGG